MGASQNWSSNRTQGVSPESALPASLPSGPSGPSGSSSSSGNGAAAAASADFSPMVAEAQSPQHGRAKTERPSRHAHTLFRSSFDHAPIGMALVDRGGRWLEVNEAFSRITGYSRNELKATTLGAMIHPDDVALDTQPERDLLSGRIASYQVEKRFRHARGHSFWVLVNVSLVRDDEGEPLYVITQIQDISERKKLAEHLEYLVDHDSLTGLFNRRRFELELSKEAQRVARYGFSGALVLIDLDHFKDVNDALGHKAGDDLLESVAGVLRHRVRQTDVLARVGGDEFAVLLPQTGLEQARIVAEGIGETLRRHVAVEGKPSVLVTASMGVALFDGFTAAEGIASADLAMYQAKAAGRDRSASYRSAPDPEQRVSRRLGDAERISCALEEDSVLLYCQPILDLQKNEIRRYELQLSLPDTREVKLLYPEAPVYGDERSRLVQAIDSWAICKGIQAIAQYERGGRGLSLHVKVSGASLNPNVAALTESALTQAEIDPASLVLEVTDTAAIADIEQAQAFTQRLRSRGCRFVLDDFPSGLGSFYYVKNLPFDYLKIDGDFIRNIAEDRADQVVLQTIVDLAQGLGKKTIAELVADDATARILRQRGVDYALGYHVGEPRPLTDVPYQLLGSA